MKLFLDTQNLTFDVLVVDLSYCYYFPTNYAPDNLDTNSLTCDKMLFSLQLKLKTVAFEYFESTFISVSRQTIV